jgi:hypothetical protein
MMPERPLLRLPTPEPFTLRKRRGGGDLVCPSRDRQRARLDPQFERLSRAVENPREILALRDDPASIAPERAIVFEVAGSLPDFYEQARAIGLEYLGDWEDEFDSSDDFYNAKHPDQPVVGRIYIAMPGAQALKELLSLWNRFKINQRMPDGKGQWRELFEQLLDVRPWGPQDRLTAETIRAWEDDLRRAQRSFIRLEIEVWFHENSSRRATAFAGIAEAVAKEGGQIVNHAVIPEIHYDAALVDIPADRVQALIDHPDIGLARADEVMFLRPQSVATCPATDLEGAISAAATSTPSFVSNEPIAALLDGLPVENHVRLAGRLRVDDPEGLEATYPAVRREHGTEMASLIIHGDLNHGEAPISRPLYVRPVLQPSLGGNGGERTPDDRLLVDVIHQAVRRIKEGDGTEPPTAPRVLVINLSLGDENRPFARVMSPLGRLLDYLAWRYHVLFLVSAGNIKDRLPVDGFANWSEFEAATPEQRETAVLLALSAHKSQRTLLSPAESMNALTIGAAHSGSAFTGTFPNGRVDPFTDEALPNIVSAMGLGFKKIVKPELLFDGGRAPVMMASTGGGLILRPPTGGAQFFGLKTARPSPTSGDRFEDFTWGTSAATALATRAAHQIYDVLLDDAGGSAHTDLAEDRLPLILKALLVHSAQWSEKGALLDRMFSPQGQGSHFARRDDIARLLGYGVPRIVRVLDCAENRATLVGTGSIAADSALLYKIPMPDGLDGVRAFRSFTVTLAWFSPVNPRHQGYRMAALDVSAASEDKYWITKDREPSQPTDKAVVRGTVFHERRTGEAATVFIDDGHILLRVSCRAGAGNLPQEIPYALAISFEVGVEAGIAVYDEVRTRLAAQVRATVGAG